MADLLEVHLDRFPSLVAGLGLLALAAWLLWLDFSKRLHRSLALFLLLRAFFVGLIFIGAGPDEYGGRIRPYFIIGLPFAALYFAWLYHHHYVAPTPAEQAKGRLVPGAIVAGAALCEVLYWWRHDLFSVPLLNRNYTPGPLGLFLPLSYAAFALVALVFALDAERAPTAARRRALTLASLGFALDPLYAVTVRWGAQWGLILFGHADVESIADPPIFGVELAIWVLPLALVVAIAARMARRLRGPDPHSRHEARRYLTLLAFPLAAGLVASGVAVYTQEVGRNYFGPTTFAFDALWTLTAAAFVTYALVKHQLLDVDVKIHAAIRRFAILAVFLLVFSIVTQLAENFLNDTYGWAVGGLTAGLLLFALRPLENLADRVARAAAPRGRPPEELSRPERYALYAEQLELAWLDGAITRKQRILLDRLRERLGISHAEAADIERATLARASSPPGGRPPGTKGAAETAA